MPQVCPRPIGPKGPLKVDVVAVLSALDLSTQKVDPGRSGQAIDGIWT